MTLLIYYINNYISDSFKRDLLMINLLKEFIIKVKMAFNDEMSLSLKPF